MKVALSCNWIGTNGFKVNIENDWFIVISILTLSSKPKIWVFLVQGSTAKKCTEICAARAAQVFFLFNQLYLWCCRSRCLFLNSLFNS